MSRYEQSFVHNSLQGGYTDWCCFSGTTNKTQDLWLFVRDGCLQQAFYRRLHQARTCPNFEFEGGIAKYSSRLWKRSRFACTRDLSSTISLRRANSWACKGCRAVVDTPLLSGLALKVCSRPSSCTQQWWLNLHILPWIVSLTLGVCSLMRHAAVGLFPVALIRATFSRKALS
jgi:hypothetical protein